MNGHSRVPQHGLRTRGGDHDALFAVQERILNIIQLGLFLFVFDLDIREDRPAVGAAVDQVIVPVDQPFVIEVDKNAPHRVGESFVQSKPFPCPVQRGPELLQLVDDDASILIFPIPGDLHELVASDLLPRQSLLLKALLDHVMDGDARVVCSRKPESVVSLHPPPANDDIRESEAEGMAHMQRASDIGRRKNHGEHFLRGGELRDKQPLIDPVCVPLLLNRSWVVRFFKNALVLHHAIQIDQVPILIPFSVSGARPDEMYILTIYTQFFLIFLGGIGVRPQKLQ